MSTRCLRGCDRGAPAPARRRTRRVVKPAQPVSRRAGAIGPSRRHLSRFSEPPTWSRSGCGSRGPYPGVRSGRCAAAGPSGSSRRSSNRAKPSSAGHSGPSCSRSAPPIASSLHVWSRHCGQSARWVAISSATGSRCVPHASLQLHSVRSLAAGTYATSGVLDHGTNSLICRRARDLRPSPPHGDDQPSAVLPILRCWPTDQVAPAVRRLPAPGIAAQTGDGSASARAQSGANATMRTPPGRRGLNSALCQ